MDLQHLLTDKYVQATGILIGLVFVGGNAAEFLLNRWLSKNYYSSSSLIINFTIALLQQLTDVFNKLFFLAGFIWVQQHVSLQSFGLLPEIRVGLPLTLSSVFPYVHIHLLMLFLWIGVILLADFCQYWLHRLSHEVNILWAGHIVHHSMEAYNYAVALRQSFLEGIYTWMFFMPLAFFGIPWPLFVMAYAVSLIWQFFVHTRYIDKMGVLETVFATPSHHRVHHGRNPQYIDKNFGPFLIIWDKFFGTFEPEVEEVDYGILHPLDSNSPVWVNVHQHWNILKALKSAHGIMEKIMVVFGPPDFVPSALRFVQKDNVVQKSAVRSPVLLKKYYVFLNFLLCALSAIVLVSVYGDKGEWTKFIPLAILLTFAFSINIGLLEKRKWADYAEVLKWFLVLGSGIYLFSSAAYVSTGILLVSTALAMLTCTVWIAWDHQRRLSV